MGHMEQTLYGKHRLQNQQEQVIMHGCLITQVIVQGMDVTQLIGEQMDTVQVRLRLVALAALGACPAMAESTTTM